MKKNVVIISGVLEDLESGARERFYIEPIFGIYNINDDELYDHFFYLKDADEILDYENLHEFIYTLLYMTEYYEDAEVISLFIEVINIEEDKLSCVILVECDEDEVDFIVIPSDEIPELLKELEKDDDFECDGDCENCEFHNDEDDFEEHDLIDHEATYRFNFGDD